MNFDFITLYVSDVERSLAFYNGLLGLGVLRRFPIEDGGEIAFVGSQGQPSIELIGGPAHKDNTFTGFSVGIEVPDLEAAVEKLAKAGHPVIRGPVSPSPDTVFSFVKDPDGAEIQLIAYKK